MYLRPGNNQRNVRDARAHFQELCNAQAATILLDHGRPTAILVPLHGTYTWNPGPKDRLLARATKRFLAALQQLRTQ